jgi:hypothetical protein
MTDLKQPSAKSIEIRNAACLATPIGSCARLGRAQGEILRIREAALRAENGILVFAGSEKDYARQFAGRPAEATLDASGKTLLPGFVDAHTHPVWAGDRGAEIARRLAGESYARIAEQGGKQKHVVMADFDREIIDRVKQAAGLRDAEVLHPLLMYNLFRMFWRLHASVGLVQGYTLHRRLAPPDLGELAAHLPRDYVAVKFYSNNGFPDTPPNRAFIGAYLKHLSEQHEVVRLLDARVAPVSAGQVHLAAQDRLDAGGLACAVERHRAVHVCAIGESHRSHSELGHAAREIRQTDGAVEHRVLGVHMEVGEAVHRLSTGVHPQPVDKLHECDSTVPPRPLRPHCSTSVIRQRLGDRLSGAGRRRCARSRL